MAQLRIPLDAKRFETGLTWKDYVAQMGDTRARTEDNSAKSVLTEDERKFFSTVTQVRYVLMMAENWCGDVHRNSPLVAHAVEAMPNAQLRVFFRGQLAAREHDHRHVRKLPILADAFEHFESRHVGQPQVEDDAVAGMFGHRGKRCRTGVRYHDIKIVVSEQFLDAHLLRGVVFDDEKPLAPRFGIRLEPRYRRSQAVLCGGLRDERERAARQSVLAVLVEAHDLNRDMPCFRILLQLAEHGPSEHVREEEIERHGGGTPLTRQRQRVDAARRNQRLEPFVVRQVHEDARVMRIVFDDQDRRVSRVDTLAIVRHHVHGALRLTDDCESHACLLGTRVLGIGATSDRRAGVADRQIERERAADARGAPQLNLATEQTRELAADRQAQAGATVLPARAGISLLERLEDDSLLLGWDANAGIRHLECDDAGALGEHRV